MSAWGIGVVHRPALFNMTDVQFNEQEYASRATPSTKPSMLGSLLMKSGLAKNQNDVRVAMGIVLVIAILIIGMVALSGGLSSSEPKTPPPNIDGTPRAPVR